MRNAFNIAAGIVHAFVTSRVVLVFVTGAIVFGATHYATTSWGHIPASSTSTTHACVPIDTGGGVTQCANPTTWDSAIVACLDNTTNVIGGNLEDTLHALGACVRHRVDVANAWASS